MCHQVIRCFFLWGEEIIWNKEWKSSYTQRKKKSIKVWHIQCLYFLFCWHPIDPIIAYKHTHTYFHIQHASIFISCQTEKFLITSIYPRLGKKKQQYANQQIKTDANICHIWKFYWMYMNHKNKKQKKNNDNDKLKLKKKNNLSLPFTA